jgi:ribonuclease J
LLPLPTSNLIRSEPQIEEASEYDVIANWLSVMGVNTYRVRVSGHYYPYQLKSIVNVIKPSKVKAIHTINPNLIYNILGK